MTTRQVRQARPARQGRNRLLTNRIILAALVVLVLAALYGLVGVTRPVQLSAASRPGVTGKLSVTSSLIGCPAPGSAGTTGGGIAMANVPAGVGTGRAVLTQLERTPAGAPATRGVDATPRPGQLSIVNVRSVPAVPEKLTVTTKMAGGKVPTGPARGGLIVSTTGANAQGLDVEQLGPGGQPTARCAPAGSDFWFLSPGSTKLRFYLYLMNTDSEQADAAVGVQTDSGPLLGAQDSGIVVPPHSMVVQQLDNLVHAAKAIALHVTTSTGRIVAAVRVTSSPEKEGTWLPVAQEPATTSYLAGLPSQPGLRELYITVPGNKAAQVKVTAISPRGSYQPTGGNGINLLGHLTTGISIPSLSGFAGAIKISSTVPVTADLEVPGGPTGSPGAFIVGSEPITEQGVVAANTAGELGTTELVLAAPGRAATVSIGQAAPGAALSAQNGQVVHIPAKSAIKVEVTVPKRLARKSIIAIVVTPIGGSAPVYGGRVAVIDNLVQTVQSVLSSPAQVRLADVRESMLAVLGF